MKSKTLVACFNYKKVKLEVHVLANLFDIGQVSASPRPRFLVNSGNEYMVGTALPYFPRGGLPRVNNVLGTTQIRETSECAHIVSKYVG